MKNAARANVVGFVYLPDPSPMAADSRPLFADLARRLEKRAALAPVADKVAASGPDEREALAFLARELVACGLPYKSQGKAPVYTRTNGAFTLRVVADPRYGVPYGSLARLILAWINTEAVRTQSPRLLLGDSLRDFMRDVGVPVTTGKRGSVKAFTNRLHGLLHASFTFSATQEVGGLLGRDEVATLVTRRRVLWWDARKPDDPVLFGSYVELARDFFDILTAAPVPLDMDVLRALKKSPLGLDIYAWLRHRLSYLVEPTHIAWGQLHAQFGAEYTDPRDFRTKALRELERIAAVWPEVRYELPRGRLLLMPAPRYRGRVETFRLGKAC